MPLPWICGAPPRAREALPMSPYGPGPRFWMAWPPAAAVVGVVRFRTHRGEPAGAILDAAGRWRCPELPVLDRVLNALYAPEDPAEGGAPFGHGELDRVAAWLKGTAERADDAGAGAG